MIFNKVKMENIKQKITKPQTALLVTNIIKMGRSSSWVVEGEEGKNA